MSLRVGDAAQASYPINRRTILNDVTLIIHSAVRYTVRHFWGCIDFGFLSTFQYIQPGLAEIDTRANILLSQIPATTTAATANNARPGPMIFAIDLLVVVAVAVVLDTGFVVEKTLESIGHPKVFQALNVAATSASSSPSIQRGQFAKYILSIAPSHE